MFTNLIFKTISFIVFFFCIKYFFCTNTNWDVISQILREEHKLNSRVFVIKFSWTVQMFLFLWDINIHLSYCFILYIYIFFLNAFEHETFYTNELGLFSISVCKTFYIKHPTLFMYFLISYINLRLILKQIVL